MHPCLGTTANSLRGVNFQQTQTSRKAITNVNYSPKFHNGSPASELVRGLLLMRQYGETTESKCRSLTSAQRAETKEKQQDIFVRHWAPNLFETMLPLLYRREPKVN